MASTVVANKKPRYAVDLRSQQAECEANYVRLTKLLPGVGEQQAWEYRLDASAVAADESISLRLLETAPYTATVEVSQLIKPSPWAEPRVLRVRMYHDARMAEVVAWNGHWNLRSRYPYPNRRMYQRDEKFQLNRFLGEWLAQCLAHGAVNQL